MKLYKPLENTRENLRPDYKENFIQLRMILKYRL